MIAILIIMDRFHKATFGRKLGTFSVEYVFKFDRLLFFTSRVCLSLMLLLIVLFYHLKLQHLQNILKY